METYRFICPTTVETVGAATCLPENRFSVIYADRNEIRPGSGIIVVFYTDLFAFRAFVHSLTHHHIFRNRICRILPVNIHPCQIRFAVALYHAEEFPAVALIKAGMVGNQIGRRNALSPQIFHSHVQKLAGDA